MTTTRAGIALGLGLFAAHHAGADEPAWAPVGREVPAAVSPTPAGRGLVFATPPARRTPAPAPAARPTPPPTPASGGLTWRPASGTMPTAVPAPPAYIPPADAPQTLPAPRPVPREPSLAYPPIPGPTLVPHLTPPAAANTTAAAWSGQVWGTGGGMPVVGDPGHAAGPVYGPAIEVRHNVVGSPEVRLSRDYGAGDLFGGPPAVGRAGSGLVGVGRAGDGIPDNSFVSAEYLLWWVNRGNIPVLASTSTDGGFGFVGEPGARSLLGPGAFGPSFMDGLRVRAGTWFADGCDVGVDAGFFFLGRRSDGFAVGSDAAPTLTRPFFAPNPGIEGPFGELVAAPGLATGALVVENNTFLWGADVNLLRAGCRTCDTHRFAFAGFRHLNLDEGLSITETITAGPTAPLPEGTAILVRDSFIARNRFYGGQVGYAAGRQWDRVDVQGRASVALGVTRQELEIDGFQGVTPPGGATAVFNGGLLAAGPNLGTFTRDTFSVVPELTVNVGCRVTPNVRAFVGYNLLYWSGVVRPGDSIDTTVDTTFVPNGPGFPFSGQNRPQPKFDSSGLWVHGVSFGAELRW